MPGHDVERASKRFVKAVVADGGKRGKQNMKKSAFG
jgi:hypothetical protein